MNTGHIHLPARQFLLKDGLVGLVGTDFPSGRELWSLDYCHRRGTSISVAFPKEDISVNFWVKFQECSQAGNLSSTEQVCQRRRASIQWRNNCFDGSPGSAFLLQPFIGSRRLEIGAIQIGSQPYTRILASPIIGLSSTDWSVSRLLPVPLGGGRGRNRIFIKSDW